MLALVLGTLILRDLLRVRVVNSAKSLTLACYGYSGLRNGVPGKYERPDLWAGEPTMVLLGCSQCTSCLRSTKGNPLTPVSCRRAQEPLYDHSKTVTSDPTGLMAVIGEVKTNNPLSLQWCRDQDVFGYSGQSGTPQTVALVMVANIRYVPVGLPARHIHHSSPMAVEPAPAERIKYGA